MTAPLLLVVALGGLVGAPSRFLVDRLVTRRLPSELPWGTWLVNMSGSFVLGLLTGLSLAGELGSGPNALLGTGFCGAYTTFSTFTFETMRLVEEGELLGAAAYVLGSAGVGLAAAGAGMALGLLA